MLFLEELLVKYKKLLHLNSLIKSQKALNINSNRPMSIRTPKSKDYYFIKFLLKKWNNKFPKELNTNWKTRLSFHPDDLENAWTIVYPLLSQNVTAFKVINLTHAKNRHLVCKKIMDDLKSNYQYFKDNSNTFTPTELRQLAFTLSERKQHSRYSTPRFISFFQYYYRKIRHDFSLRHKNQIGLCSFVEVIYQTMIDKSIKKFESSRRFIDGMQITIYLPSGSEKKHQILLKTIESKLAENNIRSGVIYPTDRKIGSYTSVRHPGRFFYHPATEVSTYNPDSVDDPFEQLSQISSKAT